MSAQTIRTALGLLQDDPDQEKAWNDLEEAVTAKDAGIEQGELARLLEAARHAHEGRREWDAVVKLLELEVALAAGTPGEAALQADLARVFEDEILDDKAATTAYKRLLELAPGDRAATEAMEQAAAKRERWKELVDRYMEEVEGSTDPAFKSSLLMSAAETAWRYGGKKKGATKEIITRLEQSLATDPKNRRAATLLERIYRREERWEDAARVLETLAVENAAKDERVAAFVRLGRLLSHRLGSPERAIGAYERVLDMAPGHPEAMSHLAKFFSEKEQWDHLVALYEDQLKSGGVRAGQETGIYIQIAMVQWRMRERPEAAEPWFERVRKAEPANPGMLAFFRDFCAQKDQRAKLVTVLSDAQRALPEGKERAELAAEIARLAEGDANSGKAIEQYKSILRQDPGNREARDALRRLYTQTESWNALVELLRQELERAPADDKAARLTALHDIAKVYRQHIKSDTALVTVLTQIVQLDETDVEAIRDLVRVYESLSRWRDLLTYQHKLADLTDDGATKVDLYRTVASRWLEQFSNVANAIEAYEAILRVQSSDEDARAKLRELYGKRRAWPQLYALSERELEGTTGADRVALLVDMAKMAAERLDRGADAIRLYREALALDPSAPGVLDALEKQAERDRDFATVAQVLELRVEASPDDAARLAVLQKLGAVYAERLNDQVGAARTWRRVLELSPGHAKALRVLRDAYLASGDLASLEELYAAQSDWEGLAEVLSSAADRATDPELKVQYSLHVAKIYEQRVGQPERAFRAYERVLSVNPTDSTAARALVPIYEREERWPRLLPLYEILLGNADTTEERVALYRKLAEVSGKRLSDKAAAVAYAKKAYVLAPTDPASLDFLELTARDAGAWDALTDAIKARLDRDDDSLGTAGRRALRAKLAGIFASELGRVDEAAAAYKTLVEEDPSDAETVETLDRLLRSTGRSDDLRWLFELRAATASQDDRARLYSEWATLEEEVFGDPKRAVFLLRKVLEAAPEDGFALSALGRLLLAEGDADGASQMIARRRDLATGATRAERELDLAELYAGKLDRPVDALDASVRALELSPHDPRAISLLEKLVELPATRARAAGVLQEEYGKGGDGRREAEALRVMLDSTADPGERLSLFAKLADVQEKKLGAAGAALDVLLRAVNEMPTELTLWDRASDLAQASSRPIDLAEALKSALMGQLPEAIEVELAERAATTYDDRLGNPEGAVPYLERVLARQPGNERAFARLKQILTSTERWSQLEELYERVTAATHDVARQVELYAEVALVCEEITGENAKAIRYYERILELDSLHEQALKSLDGLYQSEKRPRELAKLLDRRLGTATSDETRVLKLRLGRIHLDELHEPAEALDHLAEVLRSEPNNDPARELVERILEVGSLRTRAAEVLEAVYEGRNDARNLVRTLEIRLEAAQDADARRDLWRRIASLRDESLHDDAGAIEALARLVPLDPADAAARQRLVDIGRRLDQHQRVANVLLMAAENAEPRDLRASIMMEAAAIYEDLLGDRARAEEIFQRVVALDPTDPLLVLPAARSLERLYASTDPAKLADVLRLQVKLEENGDARRELWARLGDLCETVQGDLEGAITAWRARLSDDPADERALVALERLYERTGAFRDLVPTLRAREEASKDPEVRRALLVKAAQTLADKLGDTDEAILAWRAVIDEFGPDRPALGALEALYLKASSWHDLAETLTADLGLADEPEARLDLLARLGDVRRTHLDDLVGALDAYRQALTLEPSHGPSRDALEALLEVRDARREASEILHPLYEADGNFEKLLRVLEIESDTADTPSARLAVLEQAVRTAEGPLTDPARAFALATRGLREAASDASFSDWLARVEGLATTTGRHTELFKVLSESAPDVLDDDLQLRVRIRLAELARHQLGDRTLSRDWYKKALELRSDDRTALTSLESLYEEMGDAPALLDVVQRRVEAAENDAERRELLYKQAKLTRTVHDAREAITTYEAILDLGLDGPAIAALEQLYESEGRHHDLVALYERQIGDGFGDKAELAVKLAAVAEKSLGDVHRAFDELEKALAIDPQHAGAIAALERLLREGVGDETRARAGEMLEPVYLRRADWKSVMATLEARLAASHEPQDRRGILKRLAQLHEEQEESYVAALETVALLLHDDLSDEETWAECERLAKVAGAEARLAAIFAKELDAVSADEPHTAKLARRTGELFASHGESERALVYYRRALAFEPESRDVFAAVDGLLVKLDRAAERVELFRSALDHRTEPHDRLSLLHVIAELEEGPLALPEKAIDTYRAAVDEDPRDARSLDALGRLYRAARRWHDIADLYQRRADAAEGDVEAASGFRLALARLYANELADPSASIDQLEEIVRATPWNRDAIAELEKLAADDAHKARVVEILLPLYERSDSYTDLVRINEQRLSLATDAGEKIPILLEIAKLHEQRGNDPTKAFAAVRQAFALDPENGDVRGELERLAALLSAWDALAESYEGAIASSEPHTKRELLGVLAKLHDERRDDPRAALSAYDRLFALDESDREPLEAMDQLAMMLSDWPTVVRVLGKKAGLSDGDEEKASLLRRVGEAKRDMLDDADGAISAYEEALTLEPDSSFTVDCLIELLERKDDARRLVDLYRRRIELSGEDDADLKYDLAIKMAQLHETKLGSRRDAIEALREALAARPADRPALDSLDRLLRAEELWPDLLDNLRLRAATAEEIGERVSLRRAMGDLYREKLSSPEDALECYRQVLEEAHEDDAAIAATRALGERHEELRAAVADVLDPVLRAAGRAKELADILEMRLSAQTDPFERAQTLRNLALVHEHNLSDPRSALGDLLRALAEKPEDDDLHQEVTRLAEATEGGFGRYADTLAERAGSGFDAQVNKALLSRLGRVAEEKLSDDARAITAYKAALDAAGDEPGLLAALDRLYQKTGEHRSRGEILERRVAQETEPSLRADLLVALAALQIEKFDDAASGLSTLRQCLDGKPDHVGAREALEALSARPELFADVAETLEGVYRTQRDHGRLATLLERRIAGESDRATRVRRRLELSRVLEDEAKDAAAAQRVLESALTDDPTDADVLAELERLGPVTSGWASIAATLDKALAASEDVPRDTARELYVRLAGWQKDKVGDPRAAETAFEHALERDPESLEILRALEELRRGPGRERDLCETLRRRAKVEPDIAEKRTLLREAKVLAEGAGDAKLAEDVVRQLLAENEADPWALEELTRLREAAGDFAEVVKLLLRSAEASSDGAEATRLRHRAAATRREQLADDAGATTLYEELLEADATDSRASEALRALYEKNGATKELARLLARLIDVATSAGERSRLRLELARLSSEKLGATNEAIDALRAVLEEEPGQADAVVALSQIYEKTGKDDEMAELLSSQIDLAKERGDQQAELAFMVRLGEIYEGKLKDTSKAIATYDGVLARDPSHRGALLALARLHEGRGNDAEAAVALGRLLDGAAGDETVSLALRLAAARSRLKDDAGARVALERARDADAKNAEVRDLLRSLYERTAAFAELAELVAGDADLAEAAPEKIKLLSRAASIHRDQRKDAGAAASLLEKASALAPDDRDLLLSLCDAYTASGRGADAVTTLERIKESYGGKRSKELAGIHQRLAQAYLSGGDKPRALTELDAAFKIDPGSVATLRDLGLLTLEMGELDRAQKAFRALLLQKLEPPAPITKAEVFFRLGEISHKQGDKPKAVQMLERAVENDSGLTAAKELLAQLKA
jgi:tetratricopeptide (TPR) repeat protein